MYKENNGNQCNHRYKHIQHYKEVPSGDWEKYKRKKSKTESTHITITQFQDHFKIAVKHIKVWQYFRSCRTLLPTMHHKINAHFKVPLSCGCC